MTHYIRSGNTYRIASDEALDIRSVLEAGTYTVKFDQRSGTFYLEDVDDFEVSGKIYGDAERTADRIISTFLQRDNSTGVMLSGDKGGGKTLQAKILSLKALSLGIPTVVINEPWAGEEFNSFIQSIDQAAVVIFDEFEKVYDTEEQEKLLTLLDGVYPSKKMFVITCNNKYRVNEHMRNRPGRIYYRLDYAGLEEGFIAEYCQDNLLDKQYIPDIEAIAQAFGDFNFDILKAMVEEMNRYGETPQEVMKILNAKPEYSSAVKYDVVVLVGDVEADIRYGEVWEGNPLTETVSVHWSIPAPDKRNLQDFLDPDEEGGQNGYTQMDVSDLKTVDTASGRFTFQKDNVTFLLTKVQAKKYDWSKSSR